MCASDKYLQVFAASSHSSGPALRLSLAGPGCGTRGSPIAEDGRETVERAPGAVRRRGVKEFCAEPVSVDRILSVAGFLKRNSVLNSLGLGVVGGPRAARTEERYYENEDQNREEEGQAEKAFDSDGYSSGMRSHSHSVVFKDESMSLGWWSDWLRDLTYL